MKIQFIEKWSVFKGTFFKINAYIWYMLDLQQLESKGILLKMQKMRKYWKNVWVIDGGGKNLTIKMKILSSFGILRLPYLF